MATSIVKVTYADGRVVTAKVTPKAQVMTEEYLGGLKDENVLRYNYYLAWASVHKAGKESRDFVTWLEDIDDADVEAQEPAVPTPETPSSDTSSD